MFPGTPDDVKWIGGNWQGGFGGMCDGGGTIQDAGDIARYWGSTSDNNNTDVALYLYIQHGNAITGFHEERVKGMPLRCVLSQVNPPFSAGSITTGATTTTADVNPGITIGNSSDASGGNGTITYEWRCNGTPLTGSASTYSIDSDPDNYSTPGTYTFTRWAKDGACAYWVASSGAYTLTVEEPRIAWNSCPGFTMITNRKSAGSGRMNWNEADAYCKGIDSGWRLPTKDELECICNSKGSLPDGYYDSYHWSSTPYDSDSHHTVDFEDCSLINYNSDSDNDTDKGPIYVKCVK
jgi:hypothetical protein